jgi:cytoskeletal protein CcmA (bactofilin family)
MALLKKSKKDDQAHILDIDASMQGSMVFKDPVTLRIQGKFEGRLDTKGVLMIGEKAEVKADIIGETIIVSGKVTGTIVSSRELKLIAPAKVTGEIKTPLLNIEHGALFNGICQMPADVEKNIYNKGVLSLEEVSQYLSVDIASLSSWAEQGKVPAFKEAGTWKFEKVKIDDWIAAGKIS